MVKKNGFGVMVKQKPECIVLQKMKGGLWTVCVNTSSGDLLHKEQKYMLVTSRSLRLTF